MSRYEIQRLNNRCEELENRLVSNTGISSSLSPRVNQAQSTHNVQIRPRTTHSNESRRQSEVSVEQMRIAYSNPRDRGPIQTQGQSHIERVDKQDVNQPLEIGCQGKQQLDTTQEAQMNGVRQTFSQGLE